MSFTPMMHSPASGIGLEAADLTPDSAQPVSLEDRMANAYANASQESSQERNALMRAASDNRVTSDPGRLYQLQTELSEYVIKMNLTSTLARKAVGCVETLIKAQ
jgi:uncharacterized protein YigA (DUF484 family)